MTGLFTGKSSLADFCFDWPSWRGNTSPKVKVMIIRRHNVLRLNPLLFHFSDAVDPNLLSPETFQSKFASGQYICIKYPWMLLRLMLSENLPVGEKIVYSSCCWLSCFVPKMAFFFFFFFLERWLRILIRKLFRIYYTLGRELGLVSVRAHKSETWIPPRCTDSCTFSTLEVPLPNLFL